MNRFNKVTGLHFAPDNHVVPILRLGQFHRVEKAGYFWINPFIEKTLPPISTGLQVGSYTFDEVLSQDNIPFSISLTVLFQFDPQLPTLATLAQLVRLSSRTLQNIVRDYASQGLRRLVAAFPAHDLAGRNVMITMERDLTRHLHAQLYALGLIPLKQGGVLIKEVVAPVKFRHTMLAVQQHQATLQLLKVYEGDALVEQAIRAQFLMGLEGHKGDLNLWASLDGTPMSVPYSARLLETDHPDKKTPNGVSKTKGTFPA